MDNKIIGSFEIISEIGLGGMGIVYKAYDSKLERFVAIKSLKKEIIDKPNVLEKFKKEAKNQAQMNHPNVVSVYGFLEEDDFVGIVMEYVEGNSLDKIIFQNKRIHIYKSLSVIKSILLGLNYAHSKGYVHRDIKPSNIIITHDGVVKILDFGISKTIAELSQNQYGVKAGTSYYMSPEQILGENVDYKTDIYSVGITFYEMLTGELPFNFKNEKDVFDSHLYENPQLPSSRYPKIHPIIDELIIKALSKNPDNRYKSCADFLSTIDKVDVYLAKLEKEKKNSNLERKKSNKSLSIIGFSSFIILLFALSYFAYTQVDGLFKSNQIDKFREYSIFSILKSDIDFTNLKTIEISTNSNLTSIFQTKNKNLIGCGSNGLYFYQDKLNNKWQIEIVDSLTNFNDVYANGNKNIFLVGEYSAFYVKEINSSFWNKVELDNEYSIRKINFYNESVGGIVGSKGLIMLTTDGGLSWKYYNYLLSEAFYDIKFINEKTLFVCGTNGTILKSEDFGLSWQTTNIENVRYFKSMDFIDILTGVVVGGNGSIYRTNDAGKTWTKIESNTNQPLNKVVLFDQNYGIIVGNKGTILASNNWGKKWGLIDSKNYINFNSLSTSNDVFYITTNNGKIIRN